MINLMLNIAKTIVGWLLAGFNQLKVSATPPVLKYLEVLEKIATRGIGGPLALGAIAFLGFWITTGSVDILQSLGWNGKFWSAVGKLFLYTGGLWTGLIAIAGIISFAYVWLLGILASPIGVLANAAVPSAQNMPSAPVTIGWKTLPSSIITEIRDARLGLTNALHSGVTEYVSQVRFTLIFLGSTYFFAAALPGLRGTLVLLMVLGALVMTAVKGYKTPTASFLRYALGLTILWCILGKMFPVLNPFVHFFGASPEQVTMTDIRGTAKSTWDSINTFVPTNWSTPAFWLTLIVLGPLLYAVYMKVLALVRGTTSTVATSGGEQHHVGDHHGATTGGMETVKIVAIVALIALILVVIGTKVLDFHERHGARIGAEMELRKIRQLAEAQVRAAASAPKTASAPPATSPTPAVIIPAGLKDLKNPKILKLALTERWSAEIARPVGQSFRTDPPEYPVEVRINGRDIWERIPGVPTPLPRGTKFFALRARDNIPTNITVGVGWATSH